MATEFKGTYIIGADTGNGNVKTATSCTSTSVTRLNKEPLTDHNILRFNGATYVIGQGHKSVITDKTADEDYYILTLFCIGKELSRLDISEASVIIAAGLPVTWMVGQSSAYSNYLKKNRNVEFTLDGKLFKVVIKDAVILPQGYPALIEHLPTMKGDNMLADIGNGTINIMRIRNGTVIEDSYTTESFGVNECVKAIISDIRDKSHYQIDETTVLDFIRTGESDISEIYVSDMKRKVEEYCSSVIEKLIHNGYNRDFMRLFICGGGAKMFKKFCPKIADDDRITLITNIKATAIGYELMVEKMLRDIYGG